MTRKRVSRIFCALCSVNAQDSGADAVQQQAPESPADDDDKKFNSMLDGIFGKEAK